MSSDKAQTFWRYGKAWLRAAFAPAWDVFGWVGVAVGLVLWIWHKYWPASFQGTAEKIGLSPEAAMSDLVWQVPLSLGGVVLLYRIVRAPYEIHLAQAASHADEVQALTDRLPAQIEPLVIEFTRGVEPYEETLTIVTTDTDAQTQDISVQKCCRVRIYNPNNEPVTEIRVTATTESISGSRFRDVPLHIRHDTPESNSPFQRYFNLGPKSDEYVDVVFGNSKHDGARLFHVVKNLSQELDASPVDVIVKASSADVAPSLTRLRVGNGIEGHKLTVIPMALNDTFPLPRPRT